MGQKQVSIHLIQAGNDDYASAAECNFLLNLLPLYNGDAVKDRAEVRLQRCSSRESLISALREPADIVHVACHSDSTSLAVGSDSVFATEVAEALDDGCDRSSQLFVSFGCEMGSDDWVKALTEGAHRFAALIGSKQSVHWNHLACFGSSFYSAYLGTIHRGRDQEDRAWDSFRIALAMYKSVIPQSAQRVKVRFAPVGKNQILPAIELPK